MNFWLMVFIGLLIGAAAQLLNWSYYRTLVIAFIVGFAVALLQSGEVEAAGNVDLKLKTATAHLANGSGFLLKAPSGKTYLVTNFHVCLKGSWLNKLTGSLETGEVVQGVIIKRGIKPDLCAAKVSARTPAPLTIGSSLVPLQQIYTRGYPYGVLSQSAGTFIGRMKWEYMFGLDQIGECADKKDKVYGGDGILEGCQVEFIDNVTTLYSRPGSSGSPVVNSDGELVGVVSSWMSEQDSAGMVRLEDIQEFFRGL